MLKVLTTRPELQIAVKVETIEVEGSTLFGRIALLIKEGWFDERRGGTATWTELQRRGFQGANNTNRELARLAEKGFLTKEDGGYQAVAGMKRSIVDRAA